MDSIDKVTANVYEWLTEFMHDIKDPEERQRMYSRLSKHLARYRALYIFAGILLVLILLIWVYRRGSDVENTGCNTSNGNTQKAKRVKYTAVEQSGGLEIQGPAFIPNVKSNIPTGITNTSTNVSVDRANLMAAENITLVPSGSVPRTKTQINAASKGEFASSNASASRIKDEFTKQTTTSSTSVRTENKKETGVLGKMLQQKLARIEENKGKSVGTVPFTPPKTPTPSPPHAPPSGSSGGNPPAQPPTNIYLTVKHETPGATASASSSSTAPAPAPTGLPPGLPPSLYTSKPVPENKKPAPAATAPKNTAAPADTTPTGGQGQNQRPSKGQESPQSDSPSSLNIARKEQTERDAKKKDIKGKSDQLGQEYGKAHEQLSERSKAVSKAATTRVVSRRNPDGSVSQYEKQSSSQATALVSKIKDGVQRQIMSAWDTLVKALVALGLPTAAATAVAEQIYEREKDIATTMTQL